MEYESREAHMEWNGKLCWVSRTDRCLWPASALHVLNGGVEMCWP